MKEGDEDVVEEEEEVVAGPEAVVAILARSSLRGKA